VGPRVADSIIEESKKIKKLKNIFSRHEEISLRVEKDQNIRRIAKLRCFDKMR
jgi:proteasome assembly chaperone (PAC2) family protein